MQSSLHLSRLFLVQPCTVMTFTGNGRGHGGYKNGKILWTDTSFIVRAYRVHDAPQTSSSVSTGMRHPSGSVLEPGTRLCAGSSERKKNMNN